MAVFFSIEDREGEALEEVFELDHLPRHFPKDGGLCLRFVKADDDASFNAAQAPILVSELEALSAVALDAKAKAELDRVLKLCKKHGGKRHTHLRFYGEAGSDE
ncbi:MAG TPA: hypothetical protein PLC54_02045 [Spirochaetales bacterium]|nr:hypothetical protein [Spirochaetales bacterium]